MGKFLYKIVLPLAVIALTVLTYTMIFRPKHDEIEKTGTKNGASAKKSDEKNGAPELRFKASGTEISHLVDGIVKWTLKSDYVDSKAETGKTYFKNTSGIFVGENDRGLEFNAPLTFFDSKEKKLKISGDVVGKIIPEGFTLKAKEMDWNDVRKTVIVRNVAIRAGDSVINSESVEVGKDFKSATFTGNVRIEIPINREVK